jgi:ankyrin repeat protein
MLTADIDAQDKDSGTLLHPAVTNGDPVMLENLLENGANPYDTEGHGRTPL